MSETIEAVIIMPANAPANIKNLVSFVLAVNSEAPIVRTDAPDT
jgi:hypothetical protein